MIHCSKNKYIRDTCRTWPQGPSAAVHWRLKRWEHEAIIDQVHELPQQILQVAVGCKVLPLAVVQSPGDCSSSRRSCLGSKIRASCMSTGASLISVGRNIVFVIWQYLDNSGINSPSLLALKEATRTLPTNLSLLVHTKIQSTCGSLTLVVRPVQT